MLKDANFFLRELNDFRRFFWRTTAEDKAILFYAENENYYPYFEGLIKKLISEYDGVMCYVTSSPNDPILQSRGSRIKTFFIDKLLPFFMLFVNCKVFVMTLSDLNQFHLKRSVNQVHYVYVFHAMASTHMMYRYGALDHYDSILCTGPHQVKEIRLHERQNRLKPKKLVEAGYYKLERIYEAYRDYLPANHSSAAKGTVLIAPSWGDGNILESCGERLIKLLLEAGYKVIVRPHPETVKRSPGLLAIFAAKFGDTPNFILEENIVSDDSLLKADVLICDLSGVAIEYAFGTERPVLFLDIPPKIKNKRFRELGIEPLELSLRPEIGVIVSFERLEIIPDKISNLMANREAYKRRMAGLRGRNVYAFGHSSDIGAQYIKELLKDDKNQKISAALTVKGH